jgi:Mycothiol-dependent nitroreductase Rv2466c
VVDVQRQRSYVVDWRFISLWIVNEGRTAEEWYTPQYRQGHYLGHQMLRIADAIRTTSPDDAGAVGRWYTALGEAIHVQRRRKEIGADPVGSARELLRSTGFDADLAAAADDDSHDAHLRAETDLALGRTGRDVGTPILTFHPGTEREASFFGPVISKAPRGAEALELWDAVEKLATMSGVAELKRSNRQPLDFT